MRRINPESEEDVNKGERLTEYGGNARFVKLPNVYEPTASVNTNAKSSFVLSSLAARTPRPRTEQPLQEPPR